MDVQVPGNRLVDLGQELDERDRVVPFDDVGQDGAVDDVHRGHQRNGPMAAVLEFPACRPPWGHRAGRVFARFGLDTGLFVDAEQHRVRWRVDVQLADVFRLGEERRIRRAVPPAADAVGFDVQIAQDPADLTGRDRDPVFLQQVFGDSGVRPYRLRSRWNARRGRHPQQPGIRTVDEWPTRSGPVCQRLHPVGDEPVSHPADRVDVHPDQGGDLRVGTPVGRRQHDPRAGHLPDLGGAATHQRLQPLPPPLTQNSRTTPPTLSTDMPTPVGPTSKRSPPAGGAPTDTSPPGSPPPNPSGCAAFNTSATQTTGASPSTRPAPGPTSTANYPTAPTPAHRHKPSTPHWASTSTTPQHGNLNPRRINAVLH